MARGEDGNGGDDEPVDHAAIERLALQILPTSCIGAPDICSLAVWESQVAAPALFFSRRRRIGRCESAGALQRSTQKGWAGMIVMFGCLTHQHLEPGAHAVRAYPGTWHTTRPLSTTQFNSIHKARYWGGLRRVEPARLGLGVPRRSLNTHSTYVSDLPGRPQRSSDRTNAITPGESASTHHARACWPGFSRFGRAEVP